MTPSRGASPGVHSSRAPTGSCPAPASATLPLSCMTGAAGLAQAAAVHTAPGPA